jgi:hypothetical protein
MKKYRKEKSFLEELRKIPNISLACEKVGIARNTVYRWRSEDSDFDARVEEALASGVDSISDLAESKLVTNINNGSMRAIQYWLDNHKPDYIRPRAKDFWQRFFPNDIMSPLTAINIVPVDPEMFNDPARRGQMGMRLYGKVPEPEKEQVDTKQPDSPEDQQTPEDKANPKESGSKQ